MGIPGEHTFNDKYEVTPEMAKDFNDLGYILIRSLLDKEEVDMIIKCVTQSDAILKETFSIEKGERKTLRTIWNHPGSDVTGMVARSEKVVKTCSAMLGGDVYHYHSKFMLKDAKIAAPHYWHQDYGYWYHNGCLYPDMMTVFVALDPSTKQNGCLYPDMMTVFVALDPCTKTEWLFISRYDDSVCRIRSMHQNRMDVWRSVEDAQNIDFFNDILPGSHKCGRIQHHPHDGQFGADMTRVNEIRNRFPLMYAELNPGDAIFFHCNILHHSSAKRSDLRRWAFLMTYNRVTNNPVVEHHHPRYTPLEMVPNSAIKACTNFTDMSGKDFINPNKNTSLTEGYKEKKT